MVKAVELAVIAIVFIVISRFIEIGIDKEKNRKYKKVIGVIDRTIVEEGGNAYYYVSFKDGGESYLAKTDHYSSSTMSLDEGEEVEIGYYETKGGEVRAVILDDRVVPVFKSIPRVHTIVMLFGLVLLWISVVMFFDAIS